MNFIINYLLFILPIPFVLSQYEFFSSFGTLFYYSKHGIVMILFVLFFLKYLFKYHSVNKKDILFMSFFLLYISFLIMNWLLFSNYSLGYFFYIGSFFILIAMTYCAGRVGITMSHMRYVYYSLLISIGACVLVSFLFDYNVSLVYVTLLGSSKIRWVFGFNHPGVFSSFCLIVSILSFLLIKSKIISKFHYTFFFVGIVFILLSYTRNSFISLLLFSLIAYSSRTIILLILLTLVCFVLGGYGFLANYTLINSLSSGRIGIWVLLFLNNYDSFNWFVGTGLGNAKTLRFFDKNTKEEDHINMFHVDNFFYEIFLQCGLIGLFLIVLFILFLYWNIYVTFSGAIKRHLYGILTVLIFYAMFDSSFISTGNVLSVVLWLLFFVIRSSNLRRDTIKC